MKVEECAWENILQATFSSQYTLKYHRSVSWKYKALGCEACKLGYYKKN